MQKEILFFKIGSFSHINKNIEIILRKNFPENKLTVIDVWDIIKSDKALISFVMGNIVRDYGFDILTKRKNLKDCLFITPHIFNTIKKIAQKSVRGRDILFTFQTQSLFDASTEGIPHFTYTDHTFLENLKYPDFNTFKMPSLKWLKMEKAIYHNAAANFTMSSNITNSMVSDYDVSPEKVILTGAGSNLAFSPLMEGKRNYSTRNILFVGKRWERKGGPELLRAFEKISVRFPDASLFIVGSSPEVKHPNIHITGDLPLEKVMQYYADASVFCLPTRLEPFGIVFLEAMMFSLPVVATSIGAIPDFIRHEQNGLLVRPDDPDQLADALSILLEDPEKCRQYGEAGYHIYTEQYTWEKVGIKISSKIRSITGLDRQNENINPVQLAGEVRQNIK